MRVLLASSSACILIKIYGQLNILTYSMSPVLTINWVVNAILFINLENISYKKHKNHFRRICQSKRNTKDCRVHINLKG